MLLPTVMDFSDTGLMYISLSVAGEGKSCLYSTCSLLYELGGRVWQ